jgi:hypothetical protein
MSIELGLVIVFVLLAFAEFYVWYSEVLWHRSEKKADRRNWSPRR